MCETIRVLQIAGYVVGGGVESILLNYDSQIDHRKVQFDFVVDGEPLPYFVQVARHCGSQVYPITPYKKNIIRNMIDIYRIIKYGHYNIVHSHLNTMSGFSLFIAWLAGVPIRILHNHATAYRGEGIKTLIKYILRPFAKFFANQYCACSQSAALWMYGDGYEKSCMIVRNAIDFSIFLYDIKKRRKMRKKLECGDAFVIGHVGRLTYAKNHRFLLSVFSEILKIQKNALLIIIGDGEMREEITQMIHNLKLQDHVRMVGVQEHVEDWLQAMDIFIFPSWYEGLGMAAIEAQATGLPVLASENVPEEALFSSHTARMELHDGANAWAKKAIELVQRNYRESQRCAIYDIGTSAKTLESYYDHLYKRYVENNHNEYIGEMRR